MDSAPHPTGHRPGRRQRRAAALPLAPAPRRRVAAANRGRRASRGRRGRAAATCTAPRSRCCCWRRSVCACGGSSRGCPTATTSTRRRTSSRGRSRSSATTTTRSTFSTRRRTPTCCTSSSSSGSARPTPCAAATPPIRPAVFVVARVVAAALGTVVGLAHLPRRRAAVHAGRRAARRGDLRARLPADLLQPPRAQRRAHARPGVAVAVRRSPGCCATARAATTCSPALGIGLAAATKYTGGITIVCLLGAFACDALGGTPLQSVRRVGAGRGAARVLAFVAANPYSVLDFSAFHGGAHLQQSLAGGADPVKLGTTAGSGTAYYVWTLTWGLGWAPTIAAARRRRAAADPPPAGAGGRAAAGADRVHHLHGRPAALLRPLADAGVRDRRPARRLRHGRARPLADPGPRGCPRSPADRRRDDGDARPERRERRPQRRRALAPGHAQPHPRAGWSGTSRPAPRW